MIFLDKWAIRIIFPLIIIMFFKTCATNNRIEKSNQDLTDKINMIDTTINFKTVSKKEIQKIITIEGLKTEKRMIQSTDRKILDVNRQSEIDKEIQVLENK